VGEDEPDEQPRKWKTMRTVLSNANNAPVKIRVRVGGAGDYDVRWPRKRTKLKDGYITVELTIPANSEKTFDWKLRHPSGYFDDN
jgi:hypothetical protein